MISFGANYSTERLADSFGADAEDFINPPVESHR